MQINDTDFRSLGFRGTLCKTPEADAEAEADAALAAAAAAAAPSVTLLRSCVCIRDSSLRASLALLATPSAGDGFVSPVAAVSPIAGALESAPATPLLVATTLALAEVVGLAASSPSNKA